MSRRVSLPGADELFRRTSAAASGTDGDAARPRATLAAAPEPAEPPEEPQADEPEISAGVEPAVPDPAPAAGPRARRTASGRVRHDEKMTVYVTADELMEVEHARLVLRRIVGSAVDRGRVVRAAMAMALADLDEHGADSELVRRLSDT